MPVRRSRYYNNPELGAAFDNIAQMFAPPSAADTAAYASAKERNAEAKAKTEAAARLAELYDYTKNSADYDRAYADRLAIGAGAYDPSNSYYSVDQTNETSRSNNAADNRRALDQTRLQQSGETSRAMLTPIGKDQVRIVPPKLADLYDVSGTQTGIVGASEGETLRLPNGEIFRGTPKPLTEEQLKAQILQGLPQNEQRAAALSSVPVETIMDAATNKPKIVPRSDAYGAQPVPSGQVDVVNYKTPDGRTGSARVYPDGRMIDENGQSLPQGSITGKITTSSTGDFAKTTEASDRTALFATRATNASANLDKLLVGDPAAGIAPYRPGDLDYEATMGSGSKLPNFLTRHAKTEEGKAFYNNAKDFMMSILRPDTGAAIGDEEIANYADVFIPLPGDKDTVLAQKKTARDLALTALQGVSGDSGAKVMQMMIAKGIPVPPEFEAVMRKKYPNFNFDVMGAGPDGTTPAATPAPGGQSAPQSTPEADELPEGTVVENDKGERMVLRNGNWEKL